MLVVCDDKIPFLKGVFEPYTKVVYKPGASITNTDLIDADALIIRTRTICNKDLLANSKLKIIASATIGYDHIDTTFCERHNIAWTNAPGCNSSSVAQYIGSALFYLSKKYNFRLFEKTLGIVGAGNVGSKVAKLAQKLGMKTILCDPLKGFNTSIDELLQNSDIITLHTPLNDSTFHLLNENNIPKGKIIINSSRGSVVDNQALKKALINKELQGAVLDVWENEPYIDTELLDFVDIGTPHIAGYSLDGKANGTIQVVRAVSKALNLPLNDYSPIIAPVLAYSSELKEAIETSYNIAEDDLKLRANPQDFELIRGNYPIRREPAVFSKLF